MIAVPHVAKLITAADPEALVITNPAREQLQELGPVQSSEFSNSNLVGKGCESGSRAGMPVSEYELPAGWDGSGRSLINQHTSVPAAIFGHGLYSPSPGICLSLIGQTHWIVRSAGLEQVARLSRAKAALAGWAVTMAKHLLVTAAPNGMVPCCN
jgi:hypothetical protein